MVNVTETSSRGRLLLVRDQLSRPESDAGKLTKAGFEVAEVSGVTEALRRIESGWFDVVLNDVTIKDMDGLELLRQMRARSLDVPVVLMLDRLSNRIAVEAAELGALQSLVKPIEPDILEETAAYAVRMSRLRRPAAAFRNRKTQWVEPQSVSATVAKNEFGRVLDMVIGGGRVFITKHDSPKAVLLSVDEFDALSSATKFRLDTLREEFDGLLARMQTPQARRGMQAAFEASGEELGKAAVEAVRRRG
jgi:antitoxin Phd